MAGRSQIAGVFKNVQQRLMNTAQRRLTAQLPLIMSKIHEYARNHAAMHSMTGNWMDSFGVALYRDGHLVAVSNMTGGGTVGGEYEERPVRTVLVNDEIFKKGTRRHDKTYQSRSFEVGYDPERMGSSSNYFADDEVIRWLSHSSTRKKGFSYRVVSVIEYEKESARRVLFQISDEIESYGGRIWQFKLG